MTVYNLQHRLRGEMRGNMRNINTRNTNKKSARKKNTRKNKFPLWRFLALLIYIPAFLVSIFFLFDTIFRYHAEDHAYELISQKIQEVRDMQGTGEYLEATYDKFKEYEALWEQNHDFAGWLFIDDTKIDYPVMHTPDDPEYYLHRAYDRSDADSGSLFIDAAYSTDGDSLLIHGHNMKDNSMFGSLTDYKSNEFALAHSVIHFDTLTEERDYELLAAFYWTPSRDSEAIPFRYYEYPDLSSPEIFDEYISQVKALALYDTGVSASYGDKILTLSTCSYHAGNGRFVVVAVSH